MLAADDFFFELPLRADFLDPLEVEDFFAFDFVVVLAVEPLLEPVDEDDPVVPLLGLNTCALAGAASRHTMASQRIMA